MISGRTHDVTVRKVVRTKDNRALIYIPIKYVTTDWVVVRKEGKKIVIEPLEIIKNTER